MTVIAWDGQMVAADRQAHDGNIVRPVRKILYSPKEHGVILGYCGTIELGEKLTDWYLAGEKEEEWPEKLQLDDNWWSELIIAKRDMVITYGQVCTPLRISLPFFAWGSGRQVAIGAMAAGKTAAEAVEIACKHCDSCGLGVDVLHF